MSGMFDLYDILEFVIDGFHQGSFHEDNIVIHCHQNVLHVTFDLCYQLYAIQEKEVKKPLVDVSFVAAQFPADFLHEGGVFQRVPVVSVGRRYHEI